jgi:para-aminobenzoate synthetase component I
MRFSAILALPWVDPAQVLAAFADEPYAVGLLSGGGGPRARWSYVARRPLTVITLSSEDAGQPMEAARALLGPVAPADPAGPPFQGGVIGLACYELAARLEPIELGRMPGWPDLVCGLYPAVLAFDHHSRRMLAVGRAENQAAAQGRAAEAANWLGVPARAAAARPLVESLAAGSGADYERAVAEIIERIGAGEIFQANVARAWRGRLQAGRRPYELAQRLLRTSPAPFAAYLRLTHRAVVSNSPERFLQVRPLGDGFEVESRPIKGTRPRGHDAADDARLAAELLASDKDRAENLMIVDLMRNDLSRTCDAVETVELFACETYPNVHHLVSTVTGRMRAGLSGIDAFAAAFPPGSITGAPKIQAIKVIAGLEPPRGPYCGSVFWAGFDGALDSSVLIRTAVFEADGEGWTIEARAGAGIVADSQPAEEARETEAKIAAIANALTQEPA